MQYLGGKSRTANQIAGYLNIIRQPGQVYWEPFVGAGWILERVTGGERYASDANHYLIAMWQALQNGWEPPDVVTEEMYQAAKDGKCNEALMAFVGFGCSYSGKWFGGYARSESGKTVEDKYSGQSKRSILSKLSNIKTAHFFTADFMTCPPPAYGCLIYSDPPYNGTTAYGAVPPFDHDLFWRRVRRFEEQGHTVIISEYQAPDDFTCVLEMPTKTDMHTTNGKEPRIERLFRYGEHPKFQMTLWDDFFSLPAPAPAPPVQATLFSDES